jgi:pimeloyl-ACP methyl ester carboxylesterase
MKTHRIEGADGVGLHVVETGPETAPPLLLIHGWSQHHLSWSRQLNGPLAQSFRLVAPDLRGHGASDKPRDASAYDHGAPWAGDIAAIIDALALERPVLVGWSMGGWVACDYLAACGDGAIGGLVLVGSSARTGALADPAIAAKRPPEVRAEGMYAADQAEALAATVAFVEACFARPLPPRDLARMVGFNMLVPPEVRRAARLRAADHRPALAALTRPAMVVQGEEERICLPEIFAEVVAALPGPRVERYSGCGHAPFWEDAARFDADLADFARTCFETAP